MKKIFTSLLCGLMSSAALAQWAPTSMKGEKIREASNVTSYYSLDLNAIRSTLADAQETGKNARPVELKIPTLEGKMERFAVYSLPVVVKSLADRYQLGSYVGVGIDDPTAYVRFSVAPNDFQSMMIRNGVYEFIEPQNTDKSVYGVHPKTNKTEADKAFVCSTSEAPLSKQQIDRLYMSGNTFANNPGDFSRASDKKYRTMRLAMTTNGEYTQYFGGVAGALVAINATLTRCNGIFEMDFGLHLILQDFPALIYPDPNTDPYSTTLSTWNLAAQKAITAVAGEANYDIGHMFGKSGGGGNAGCIGCVCVSPPMNGSGVPTGNGKGSGITSPADGIPQGDNFDIDYVAHEMGHQLGGNHTFSMNLEGTGQNVEPGSGSTIMGYAGITGATDVQPHSDAYFHINTIIQVQTNLAAASKTCDIETPIANNPPVITPMADVTIPKGTPFVLTAQATDPEGDPITYTWEEVDNASTAITKNNLGNTTSGASFRSITGTASPTRYFPKLSTVLTGAVKNVDEWEAVSTVARASNFRVTVRDNNADPAQKQTQEALQKVTVSNNGPFKITSTKVYNNAAGPLTWDVVGTNAAPFNVTNVKIDYTADNGATWVVLAASTPNDGTEDLSFASFATNTQLKVRISAIGNVFYTIAPVTVSAIVPCDGTAPAGFAVSNVTTAAATVTWDAIAGATYVVRYKKTSESTWTEVPVATTTYTFTGLDESTSYDVQVASVCSGTTGTFTASSTFTTLMVAYCTLSSTNSNDEYISNVKITAEGAAGGNSSSGASNYTNYSTDPARLMKLAKGTTNNTISVTKAWTGSPYSEAVTVWIDFDRSGTYEASEIVMQTTANTTTPVTATFAVPADAYTGDKSVGMRVALRFNTAQTAPCGTYTYGEVEDYAVSISPTLGVNDNVKAQSLQVYPNPATDVLNVTKVSNNATYAIYNVAGQLVSKGKVTSNQVQVSKLQKGVYMISVEDNGQSNKVKFIKN
ncbi:reprolysin-like metallopeptidase [Kaistella palustris]|uniref:reprolysin-like metallopeptidase n=1 Tax=Kaistella palustris TaxID=493376 RepID=UPI000404DBE2|nr:zinc-dependent metalloprotease family protein [Kaistella palustris]